MSLNAQKVWSCSRVHEIKIRNKVLFITFEEDTQWVCPAEGLCIQYSYQVSNQSGYTSDGQQYNFDLAHVRKDIHDAAIKAGYGWVIGPEISWGSNTLAAEKRSTWCY